jgi:predicted CoA-binding protein
MLTKNQVDNFFNLDSFALIGVSRDPKKFGNTLFKEMKSNKLNVYPIHPELEKVGEDKCYRDLKSLPVKPAALIITANKNKTLETVKDAVNSGIKNIWIQLMSNTPEAIAYCKNNDVNLISKECVFMYMEPVATFHKFHRTIKKIFSIFSKN